MYQISDADVNTIREAVQTQVEVERAAHFSPGISQQQISESELWKAVNSNEDGDSWLFAQIHRGKLLYDHAAGRWYEWQGHYWIEDRSEESLGHVDAIIDAYSEGARRAAWERMKASKANDKDAAAEAEAREGAYLARIAKLQSLHRKRNVLTLAAAGKRSLGIVGEEWDCNPWLLPCPNGTIDLQTGKVRPGRQEDVLKTACPTPLKDIEAKAPAWLQSLHDIFDGDQSLISYLHRLLGYSVTGLSVEDVFPIFYGSGRNGKSTLLETLAAVLGPLAGPIQAETLLEVNRPLQGGAPRADIMALRGMRLVWASETNEGRNLNMGRVKLLSGGDTLVGREPYGKREVSFRATHTLMLLTNFRPKVDFLGYAAWARIHLVPFTLAFIDQPREKNERKCDPHLTERLQAEAPGILAWLVRGCLAWQREGLKPPDKVKVATAEYRQEEDLLGHFIQDHCILSEHVQVKAGVLYKGYQGWCEQMGHRPMNGTRFGKQIRARFQAIQDYRGVFYLGIGAKSPEQSE